MTQSPTSIRNIEDKEAPNFVKQDQKLPRLSSPDRDQQQANYRQKPEESRNLPFDNAIATKWLIEGPSLPQPKHQAKASERRRFLQIGTGQWTALEYATQFPRRQTAIIYAREFGLLAAAIASVVAVSVNHEPVNSISTQSNPSFSQQANSS
ncbi:hypothetical protein OAF09_00090 [bacterium]|nr:hypothetical protein [bacterium]